MIDVDASSSDSFLFGILFMLMGVLHFATRSLGKFMKVLEAIAFDIFFRLRVFVHLVFGVVVLTALVRSFGTSPYGSYAIGLAFRVFLLVG